MAGRTVGGMRALLGEGATIVRAMPNTPAAVRQGVTVACPGAGRPGSGPGGGPGVNPWGGPGGGVTPDQRALCQMLLEAIGAVAWVDDEGLLDPVTAVSGSGPAYVFLLAELMEQAAIEQGIPADLARLLDAGRLRVRCVVGGQHGGRGGAAQSGHQPGRHDRARAAGADGRRRLAAGDATGDRRGNQAIP